MMNENKRFEIDLDEEAITDNGEYCLSLYCFQDKGEKDVCYLLNKLNDEIEELKKENDGLKKAKRDYTSRGLFEGGKNE